MKKVLFIAMAAMCAGLTIGMTACSNAAESSAKNGAKTTMSVQPVTPDEENSAEQSGNSRTGAAYVNESMVEVTEADTEEICGADPSTWSPFTDCKSLEEAEEVAGFDISIPDKIEGYDAISYAAMQQDKLIQVDYSKDDNRYICIRKAVGDEDISGDYNVYKEETRAELDGRQVTFKGNDGKVSLATWTDGDYAYSLMYADLTDDTAGSKAGISLEQMKELVSKVK